MTALAEPQEAGWMTLDAPQVDPPAWPISVLIVEDDEDAAELARIQLSGSGEDKFFVERSRNLRHAMRRLAEPGIDVVLLDLGLPELSGYRSYRALTQAAPQEIPVVVYTSDERQLSRDITLQFGAADYLVKDQTSAAHLRRCLREAVTRWKLRTMASSPESGPMPADAPLVDS